MSELDPLSTYDYSYAYENLPLHIQYQLKMEALHSSAVSNNFQPVLDHIPPEDHQHLHNSAILMNTSNSEKEQSNNDNPGFVVPGVNNEIKMEDTKEDIKPLITKKRTRGKTGKTSNYWNKKVEDKNFPFFGCTICNISFTTILELDQHVTMHKGRLTSYDIRLKNQLKRKLKKKEQKKMKKLGKTMKKENIVLEFEIKPEDGYIGNEKASEFNLESELTNGNCSQSNNLQNNGLNLTSIDNNTSSNVENSAKETENGSNSKESEDPRLEKLFKCFACQKQFSLSYYLKLHVRSHTDEKPYTCAECGMSFITASKLGRHNKRIHLSIRFQCRICYRFFSRFEYLTRHFDKKHPDDKLEGEPYDYNAILPYLKELEEELREKAEPKDQKPKPEELWSELSLAGMNQFMVDSKEEPDNKNFLDQGNENLNKIIEVIEEVKVDFEEFDEKMDIKKEQEDCPEQEDLKDVDYQQESFRDDNCKDESLSDEDYFPLNTWASTPKVEPASPSSPKKPKRCKFQGEFPQKCEFCEKNINSASYMRIHLRTHTGERPFLCYICNKGFITSSKLHRHILTHAESWGDGENQVKLEDDVKTEDGEVDLVKKRKASIKKAKAKLNRKNIKGFTVKKDFNKRPFACVYCHQRFLHRETMIMHRKSHDGEELVLKCYFCLEPSPDEDTLAVHEATHKGSKPFLCTLCGRSYLKKESMVYHRKSHNTESKEKKDFICDICSKTFNAQCKLQRHIVSHRVDKFVLRYECPVCAHMFNTKYHIQMHLATHQKEGLIVEENRNEILAMVLQNARKIPKKSDAPINLTDLIPSDERSRVCNICGQVFQHFYYLEEHLKSHGSKIALQDESKEEVKKHICEVCNKGFKLHYYLKLHSFTHTKEKPYICQQCGKGFITKGKLKRHLETHTGLKKYQCHICYKFFTRPSYLRIHVRTIHGTQDYNFRLDKYGMPLGQDSV